MMTEKQVARELLKMAKMLVAAKVGDFRGEWEIEESGSGVSEKPPSFDGNGFARSLAGSLKRVAQGAGLEGVRVKADAGQRIIHLFGSFMGEKVTVSVSFEPYVTQQSYSRYDKKKERVSVRVGIITPYSRDGWEASSLVADSDSMSEVTGFIEGAVSKYLTMLKDAIERA